MLYTTGSGVAYAQPSVYEQSISTTANDAEENYFGRVNLDRKRLNIAGRRATVGLRFEGLDIPAGAVITNAYLQFQAAAPGYWPTTIDLYGEAASNATAFTGQRFDISSRALTAAVVNWQPPVWPTEADRGPDQQTPDLTAIVQEIVDSAGWQPGNALTFIMAGQGSRRAESSDGTPGGAPTLHVEYESTSLALDWRDLDLRFNGLSIGEDVAGKRLLLPLPAGFELLSDYSATVDHALAADGYRLSFNNGTPISPGDPVDFGAVEYGSEASVQLYRSGRFVDEYTLVFTNLPVVELDAASIVDEPKSPGFFTLNSGDLATSLPRAPMGIEFRGSTSQAFAKKSFGLEISKDEDPDDERNVSLLGLRRDGDWILDAVYRDTSFVRNITGHDIFNGMRPAAYVDETGTPQGQATIRGTQVEVILNGSYHGVYVLSERVDRKLLDLPKIDVPEDAAGNDLWDQVDFSNPANGSVIYKADTNLANLYNPESVRKDFEQDYPDEDDLTYYAPLESLINFVNTASDEEFIASVGNLVDIDSVVDFWLLTNVTADTDTLKKNYFLARAGAGKWFFVPWDNDATFSMWWNGRRAETVRFWNPNGNALIGRLTALTATGFNTRLKIRWNELRATEFSRETLVSRFANYNASVEPVAGNPQNARNRNFERWPQSGNEGADDRELGTVDYIASWIDQRLEFLDATITGLPE